MLSAPGVGWLASRHSQKLLLSVVLGCGVAGFLTLGLIRNPLHPLRWPATVALGIAQGGSTVVNLAMCARSRARIVSQAVAVDGEDARKAEIAGAVAGASSLFGGLGILVTGTFAGWLADTDARRPFLLASVVSAVPLLAIAGQLLARKLQLSNRAPAS